MAFFTLERLVKHGYCKYLDHITLVQMKYYVVHVKGSLSSNDSNGDENIT